MVHGWGLIIATASSCFAFAHINEEIRWFYEPNVGGYLISFKGKSTGVTRKRNKIMVGVVGLLSIAIFMSFALLVFLDLDTEVERKHL